MFRRFRARSVCPVARTDGLSVTKSGDETLVYDRAQFVIHRLNADTAMIWQLADGSRDLAALAFETKLSTKVVEESLAALAVGGLVKTESLGKYPVTRRRFIGGAAGAAAAVAFIAPAAASRKNGDPCKPRPWQPDPCTRPNGSTGNWQCDACVGSQTNCFWNCR